MKNEIKLNTDEEETSKRKDFSNTVKNDLKISKSLNGHILKSKLTVIYQSKPDEKLKFLVFEIVDGYKFVLIDNEGEVISNFSISKKTVDPKIKATGYVGDEGMAIEIFRKQKK